MLTLRLKPDGQTYSPAVGEIECYTPDVLIFCEKCEDADHYKVLRLDEFTEKAIIRNGYAYIICQKVVVDKSGETEGHYLPIPDYVFVSESKAKAVFEDLRSGAVDKINNEEFIKKLSENIKERHIATLDNYRELKQKSRKEKLDAYIKHILEASFEDNFLITIVKVSNR